MGNNITSVPLQVKDLENKTHEWEVFVKSPLISWQTKEIMLTRSKDHTFLYFLIEDKATQKEFYATLEVDSLSILLATKTKESFKQNEIHIGEDETILLRCSFPKPLCFSVVCSFLHSILQNDNFIAYFKECWRQLERERMNNSSPWGDSQDPHMDFSFIFLEFAENFEHCLIPATLNLSKTNHHPNSIDEFFQRNDIESLKRAKVVSMKYYQRNLHQYNGRSPFSPYSNTPPDKPESKTENLLFLHDLLVFVIKTEDSETLYFVTELFDETYYHSIDVGLGYIEKQKDLQIKLTNSHSFRKSLKFCFLLDLISRMRRKYSLFGWNCKIYAQFIWNFFTSMSLKEQTN